MVFGFKTDAQKIAIIIADVFKKHMMDGKYVKHVQKLESLLDSLSAPKKQWPNEDIRKALASMYLMLKDDFEHAKNKYHRDMSRSYSDTLPPDLEIFNQALTQVDEKVPQLGVKRYVKNLETSANAPMSVKNSHVAVTQQNDNTLWSLLQEARATARTDDLMVANVLAEKYKRLNSDITSLTVPYEPDHLVLQRQGAGRSSTASKKYVKTSLKTRSPATGRLCTVYEHAHRPGTFYIRRRRSSDGVWVHVRVKQVAP